MIYCMKCGAENAENAIFCSVCGEKMNTNGYSSTYSASTEGIPGDFIPAPRDWLITLILAILLGQFGIARFYTGNIGLGILQLLTAGGCGIWWLIDIILIVTDNYHDKWGRLLIKR